MSDVTHTLCTMVVAAVLMHAAIAQPRPGTEADHTARIAAKYGVTDPAAEINVRLFDQTRVDILPEDSTFAYEVDYGRKWAEGVGQALYYARVTGRRPALILLVKDESEHRFVYRAMAAGAESDLTVFVERIDP